MITSEKGKSMIRGVVLPMLLLLSTVLPANAAPTAEEIESAYKKGQADWDRGDLVSSMAPLRVAADGGHPKAQALLGYVLDQSDDDVEAASYYRKAAEQGNVDGMFGLAAFHISGDGDVKIDYATAKALYVRAAETGHLPSINVMVMSHINGGLGLTEEERNGASALKWYRIGADAGLTTALEQLVAANRNGKLGLPVDAAEADRLQAKLYQVMGVDPSQLKKKRQRR